MIASVYIKDGNINFYNETDNLSGIGGLAYELGRPLLNFVCYEPERFDDGFATIASAFEIPGAEYGAYAPEFLDAMEEIMSDFQQREIYVYSYAQELIRNIYSGEPPQETVRNLSKDFRQKQKFLINDIEMLIELRKKSEVNSPMEYLYALDVAHVENDGDSVYLEKPFKTFYGMTEPPDIVELYEINSLDDLIRFEFIKMIEQDIYIKKCKNCGWFFIPRRRADAEYCERVFGDTNRKCSEVGATLRYEKKVAENPILEAHKTAYRRFNSRTRAKKMSQKEFMQWTEEAAQKRDACLAGELSFNEFVMWLEQGRIRRGRKKPILKR